MNPLLNHTTYRSRPFVKVTLAKGKEVVLGVRDQLRRVFVSMEPECDPRYLTGDLRSKTRPGFETLRLRERAVDDIGVQKVTVFLFRLGQLRFCD